MKIGTKKYWIFILLFVLFLCGAVTQYQNIRQWWQEVLFPETPQEALLPESERFQAFLNHHRLHRRFSLFEAYLKKHKVYGIVPTRHLLRQGTDWQKLRLEEFAFPPQRVWKDMTQTLKVLKDYVIPIIGEVEIVSGFRSKIYNQHAGGASRSRHLHFSAIDVVPMQEIQREELHRRLLSLWQQHGQSLKLGLGLYSKLRFHIDTSGYRRW